MTKFKQLSFWARQHKWPSRFIIVFTFIIMNALGIVTGLLFNELDVSFTSWILILSMLVFSIAWIKYPKKKQNLKSSYAFRKTCDAILIGTTFLMFVYFGNRQITPFSSSILSSSAVSFSLPKDSTKIYKSAEEFKKSLYDENGNSLKWKERKKLLKQQIKAIKNDKSMSDGG